MTDLYMVRHGETAWSLSGQHTSVTDLELTENGRQQALSIKDLLAEQKFDLVLTSPRVRARETAKLAGFPEAEVDENLAEWFYGDFEGKTADEIRSFVPGWRIWKDYVPGGEQQDDVYQRLMTVANRVRFSGLDRVLVFGHGHALRVLTTCWLQTKITDGSRLRLGTATVSVLGYEKETPAIIRWNVGPTL